MESETQAEDDRSSRPYLHIIAAVFCLMLVLVSLMLVNASTHAATPGVQQAHKLASLDTPTLVLTTTTPLSPLASPSDTSTVIPTDTPTPTPTDTPTPTPTNTPTPTPSPKPTHTPAPTPTRSITPTATPTVATTPQGTTTATTATPATPAPTSTSTQPAGTVQTPTTIPGAPTTTTNDSGTPPQNQPGSSNNNNTNSSSFFTFIVAALIFVAIVSAGLAGLVLVRKRLLPSPASQQGLPPSGAKPWRRTREGSLHGNTNSQGFDSGPNMPQDASVNTLAAFMANTANTNGFPPAANSGFPGTMNGFPPANTSNAGGFPGNGNGFPPNTGSFAGGGNGFPPPNTQFSNVNSGFSPNSKENGHLSAIIDTSNIPPGGSGSRHLPPITGGLSSNIQRSGHAPAIMGDLSAAQRDNPVQQVPSAFPATSFAWPSDNLGSFTDQVKPVKRGATRLVKLNEQEHNSSGALPIVSGIQPWSNTDAISEEVPSLDNALLRDTLKQYMQLGKDAREKDKKE